MMHVRTPLAGDRLGRRRLFLVALTIWLTVPGLAFAQGRQERDGLVLYWGLVPAALVTQGHALENLHGGPPSGKGRQDHLVVAIYDARSGRRVEDASVHAQLSETGIDDAEPRNLEPMKINGQVSYGQFFGPATGGPYRFRIWVTAPGHREVVYDISANAP